MSKKKKFNISLAVFLAFIVAGFSYQSFFIKKLSDSMGVIDAALIPRLVIAGVAVVGCLCLIQDFNKQDGEKDGTAVKKTALSVFIMFVTVICLKYLGFLLMGIFFLAGQILLMSDEKRNRKKVVSVLALSAVCSVVFVLIFRYGFGIGVPILPFS